MPDPTKSTRVTRAATAARSQIIDLLKEDHRRLKRAYREFLRLDADRNGDLYESVVRRTLTLLRVHAALEEELIYPIMRPVVSSGEVVDEAEIEHEIIGYLAGQLESSSALDDKFSARFAVMCEYLLHHVKEEEGDLFPQLKRARLDWEGLCADFMERREALQAEYGAHDTLTGSHSLLPTDETGSLMTGPAVRYPHDGVGAVTSRKM